MTLTPGRKRPFHTFARFRRAEGGAVTVEYALVGVAFLLLMTGSFELGFMLNANSSLQDAVNDSGRLIRVGKVTDKHGNILMAQDTFIAKLCALAASVPNCTTSVSIDVRSASNFTQLADTMPAPITLGPTKLKDPPVRSFDPGSSAKAISVVATYDWPFSVPILKPFGNVFSGSAYRLQAVAVFQNEPF